MGSGPHVDESRRAVVATYWGGSRPTGPCGGKERLGHQGKGRRGKLWWPGRLACLVVWRNGGGRREKGRLVGRILA